MTCTCGLVRADGSAQRAYRGLVPQVEDGTFGNGVPYLRTGRGPVLLVAAGLTTEHAAPKGTARRASLAWAAPFAEHFTVYLVNRRPGLPLGTSMSDLAADYASVIEDDLGEPALLHGTSTGGSVALQLAVDRPALVRRLVVAAAACRLSPRGRSVMAEVARLTEVGDTRAATAAMVAAGTPPRLRLLTRPAGWVMGQFTAAKDQSDMLVVIAAEDVFDTEPHLDRVTAPTLVLGGTADGFYSRDLFERTAAGIPRGRAVVWEGRSHVGVAGGRVPAAVGLGYLLAE
jgi:pimeloyl-ACP methyl ester carboxylesterase